MSRFDYRDPAVDSEYCDGLKATDYIDVPDFDATEPPDEPYLGGGAALNSDLPVDPAEHCVQAIVSALNDLDALVADNVDLTRAFDLRRILHRAWMACSETDERALKQIEIIMERRR